MDYKDTSEQSGLSSDGTSSDSASNASLLFVDLDEALKDKQAQTADTQTSEKIANSKTRRRENQAVIAKARSLKQDMLKGFYILGGLQLLSFSVISVLLFSQWQMYSANEAYQRQLEKYGVEGSDVQQVMREEIRGLNTSMVYFQQLLSSQHAENNLFLKTMVLGKSIDPELARSIARYVKHYASIYQLDADMILAIMAYESAFDPDAVSSVGAAGLMQILPQWKPVLGIAESLNRPETSIKYGMQIYGMYLNMYGDTELALTAYNRGPGPVDVNLLKGRDPRNGYAAKVMSIYNKLTALNGKRDPRVDVIALARAEANLAKGKAEQLKLSK